MKEPAIGRPVFELSVAALLRLGGVGWLRSVGRLGLFLRACAGFGGLRRLSRLSGLRRIGRLLFLGLGGCFRRLGLFGLAAASAGLASGALAASAAFGCSASPVRPARYAERRPGIRASARTSPGCPLALPTHGQRLAIGGDATLHTVPSRPPKVPISCRASTFHSFVLWSWLPLASTLPSGEKRTLGDPVFMSG